MGESESVHKTSFSLTVSRTDFLFANYLVYNSSDKAIFLVLDMISLSSSDLSDDSTDKLLVLSFDPLYPLDSVSLIFVFV